jgi:glutamyl-tRNA synthetase
MPQVRLRFAPSPTGFLHVGGARTALFNWLLARKEQGKFILRIEDTDVIRSTQSSVDAILEGMTWLGLDWNEGPFYQSDNFPLYKEYVQRLLSSGKAYKCYCSAEQLEAKRAQALEKGGKPRYDGTCRNLPPAPDDGRPYVVRFNTPKLGTTSWIDLVKGKISFENSELDDLIIQRTDGTPTYNFVVVVDDASMAISTVIRGDDHVNNTPRQILLYQALESPVPNFAHVPMILGADKARLSKRHGATSVMSYRDMGYLPEAMVNYLVRLGWSSGDEEIFSLEELIQKFSIENVGRSAGVFNTDKLLWLNAHYIKSGDPQRLAGLVTPFLKERGVDPQSGPDLVAVVQTLQERAKTLLELADGALFYYKKDLAYDEKGAGKFFTGEAAALLEEVMGKLERTGTFQIVEIEGIFKEICEEKGIKLGQIGPVVRLALSGSTVSPGIYEMIAALGKNEARRRLELAIAYMKLR